ncbi:MAG: outer membrane protein assembly factor BamA [Deltaproteobacteria bacterium]|nr:MAG: outer membrane protein assembly factor BamA [Deltaproteobacteria bacterium]
MKLQLWSSQSLLKAFLLAFLIFATPLHAESVVKEIQVNGNTRVETQAIIGSLETRIGSAYSAEKIQRDLKTLYKMGSFADVTFEKVNVAGGTKLVVTVVERSSITKISFEGNKKVKEDKLRELSEVKAFSPLDSVRLSNTIRKIREHYAKEGYHLAEISPEFKKVPTTADSHIENEELIFHIHEHEPVRIARVNFIGNKVFSDDDLRSKIKTKSRSYFSWLTGGGKFQEEMVKRDSAFLVYFYQNNGYLKVKVGSPKVYLSRDRKSITVTYHITEGEKYKVKQVEVQGDILTTKQEMDSKLVLKSGQFYSRQKVEEDLQLLSALYGDQGYAFANINPVIIPNDEERTADVTYTVQRGPRVYIEKINISGNAVTRDKVIRRELKIKENTLYNESRLRESQQKVQALGYFEEVNFATPRGSSDDRIQINISVKERQTGQFSIGAGFSSVEKFILTASLAKENFLGYGVSGQFSVEASSRRQLFVLSLEDPYFLDSQWILGISGFRTINVYSDFDRKSFGGSATLGHRIFDNSTFRLTYQAEDVNISDFSTTVPAVFANNLSGLTSSIGVSLIRDTRNNRLFPSSGMYQSISSEFAGVGGDNDFVRVTENFRYYQPLWKKIVGKLNFTAAQIESTNSDPVPLFERYFMGGVNSLRGYYLRDVGPSVRVPISSIGGDHRFVFGGNKMLQLNLELELPLYDPAGFKAVTFFDTGNSFSEEENFSVKHLRSDYGFGLRWNSPFGPLRFEWGLPINRQPGESPVIFNFTIGSFF